MPESSPFRASWYPLFATTTVQLLVAMAAVTVPVMAPAIAAQTGIPAGRAGHFIALVYALGMAASLVSGPLVQRLGAIRVSQLCLLACAAGLGCVALGSWPWLVAGAVLIGLGYGPVTPASSHVLARTTPPGAMSLVFSIKQTGVPLGGAAAGLIVPWLVHGAGWQAAAVVVAVTCLASVALAQPLRRSQDADRDPQRRLRVAGLAGPLRLTLALPALRRLAFSSFCFAGLQLCLVTFLVTHLTSHLAFTLVDGGLMLAMAQGGGVVGRIGWGALADRWGRPQRLLGLVALGMALAALATASFAAAWPRAAIAVVCFVFGATAIGWNGVYLAQVARLAPAGRAGDATGGSLVFTYGGVLFGPPLFSLLTEGGVGYPAAFVAVSVPATLCGLWLLWSDRPARAAVPRAL